MCLRLFETFYSIALYHLSILAPILYFINYYNFIVTLGFPGGSEVPAPEETQVSSNAGDLGLMSGTGRSPGEGNGNPLQYSCLENPMDGEAWWATVHGVAKSWTRLSDLTN